MSDPQQPADPNQPYQPYGQPGVPWRPPVAEHPQATLILVLGILAVVVLPLLGPFAWVMGGRARKEIQASNGTIGGDTQVTIGWVLGIVGTIMLAFFLLMFLFVIVGFGVLLGTASGV